MQGIRDIVEGRETTSGLLREGRRPEGTDYDDEHVVRRLMLRGGNVYKRGDREVVISRMALGDYQDLLYSLGDLHAHEVGFVLQKICAPNSMAWKNYMALHIARRTPRANGDGGDYNVILNPVPRYAPPDEVLRAKAATSAKIKKYTLAQLFTDSYLGDKYEFSVKFRRDMQIMATTKPQEAAASLQEFIQLKSPGVKIVVEAGGYSATKQQAIATIRNLAYKKRLTEASVIADIVDRQAFVYGPGDLERKGWMVQGPIKHMESIMDIHKLITHVGMHEVMFLLSMETQTLRIDIYDGKEYISPTIISHARKDGVDLPESSDLEALSLLTDVARRRLDVLVSNVRLVEQAGEPVATAIQVSPNMTLVNDHIRKVGVELVVGAARVDQGGIPVSHDLWMQNVSGSYKPWILRPAVVGEVVAVLYHNGEAPILSAPFEIVSTNEAHILSTVNKGVVCGMSGGALVALSDMALLGIHAGATMRNLIASAYTDTMNLDLLEMLGDGGEHRTDVEDNANVLYERMKGRGLDKMFLASLDRLIGLEDAAAEHVGSAVAVGGKLYTTCQPQEYGIGGMAVPFVQETGFVSSAAVPISIHIKLDEEVIFRQPRLNEKVVVAVKHGEDLFLSHETTVRQVGVGGKTFFLRKTFNNIKSLSGGLVVSAQDSAILGMFTRETTSVVAGGLSMCVPFPTVSSAVVIQDLPLTEVVQRKLPMVHAASWDPSLLAQVFRHESVATPGGSSNKTLAAMGRSTALMELYTSLRKQRIPSDQWSAYAENLLSDMNMRAVAVELNLMASVEAHPGLVFDSGGQVQVDVMHALIQAIFDSETHGVSHDVMVMLGFVPPDGQAKGPLAPYGSMMRRPSELGFKHVESDGSIRLISPVD